VNTRDTIKNEESFKSRVILIRIREKEGFNRIKLLHSQNEVLQEIVKQFNEHVKKFFGSHKIQINYNPDIIFDLLGKIDPRRIQRSINHFL
jgi:hypothetical protein